MNRARCIDTDGDGVADRFNDFARMDHPRGLVWDHGSLWVLHPPLLSVFRDTNGDGTADESHVLIEGISTDEVEKRGADHTTNGIRMGIDGWIYIAVGDFGFQQAKGRDGRTLGRRGGGVVRVRPDGTEMDFGFQQAKGRDGRTRDGVEVVWYESVLMARKWNSSAGVSEISSMWLSTPASMCSLATTPTTVVAGTSDCHT